MGQLVQFSGTITRCGALKTMTISRKFRCSKCQFEFFASACAELYYLIDLPLICPRSNYSAITSSAARRPPPRRRKKGGENSENTEESFESRGSKSSDKRCDGRDFQIIEGHDVVVDYAEARVQEVSDGAATTAGVPTSISIAVIGRTMVDLLQAGVEATVIGVPLRRWRACRKASKIDSELFVEALGLRIRDPSASDFQLLTSEQMLRVDMFWRHHYALLNNGDPWKARRQILDAVCPSLKGMTVSKLAVVLTVIGGSIEGVNLDDIDEDDIPTVDNNYHVCEGDKTNQNNSLVSLNPETNNFVSTPNTTPSASKWGKYLNPTQETQGDSTPLLPISQQQKQQQSSDFISPLAAPSTTVVSNFSSISIPQNSNNSNSSANNTFNPSNRSDCHLLLVGDPGTGKTQLMRAASLLCRRSVFATGMGSTSVGLTCAAVREGAEWHIEAGALPLADGGVCVIDEFGQMRASDRVSVHEAMENQTITVAKAGVLSTLHARCSLIAAANPRTKNGMITDTGPIPTGIGLSLLTRFDLVLLLPASREPAKDELIAKSILCERSLDGFATSAALDPDGSMLVDGIRCLPGGQQVKEIKKKDLALKDESFTLRVSDGVASQPSLNTSLSVVEFVGEKNLFMDSNLSANHSVIPNLAFTLTNGPVALATGESTNCEFLLLPLYVQTVKNRLNPRLTEEALALIKKYFCAVKRKANRNGSIVSRRLLESLVRLTVAHARLMWKHKVATDDDAAAVIHLVESATCARVLSAIGAKKEDEEVNARETLTSNPWSSSNLSDKDISSMDDLKEWRRELNALISGDINFNFKFVNQGSSIVNSNSMLTSLYTPSPLPVRPRKAGTLGRRIPAAVPAPSNGEESAYVQPQAESFTLTSNGNYTSKNFNNFQNNRNEVNHFSILNNNVDNNTNNNSNFNSNHQINSHFDPSPLSLSHSPNAVSPFPPSVSPAPPPSTFRPNPKRGFKSEPYPSSASKCDENLISSNTPPFQVSPDGTPSLENGGSQVGKSMYMMRFGKRPTRFGAP